MHLKYILIVAKIKVNVSDITTFTAENSIFIVVQFVKQKFLIL